MDMSGDKQQVARLFVPRAVAGFFQRLAQLEPGEYTITLVKAGWGIRGITAWGVQGESPRLECAGARGAQHARRRE